MNTKTVNTKRLVALAAVVIICAAALVSVAYAYNATYKDTVSQQGLTPEETAKYIYVNSSESKGLELPALTAKLEVQYNSDTVVSDDGKSTTTLSAPTYKIAAIDEYTDKDGTETPSHLALLSGDKVYIKLGTVTVISKNVGADLTSVNLVVTKAEMKTTLTDNKVSLIDTTDNSYSIEFVKAKTPIAAFSDTDYITSVTLAVDKSDATTYSADVDVYLVATVSSAATNSANYSHTALTLDDNGNYVTTSGGANEVTTKLAIPSILVELKATSEGSTSSSTTNP